MPVEAEDGLLQLQSQALAEEEAAKARGELLTRFLKDKLAKEERSSALSLHKLTAHWRAALRGVKEKELREDVAVLSQAFARVLDCKDSVIESLVTDVEEAEAQHARALSSHLQNVDRLLQLQRGRLACLEEGFDAQLEALKAEFETERRAILEQHEQEIGYLQDVVLALEQNHVRDDHEATMNFQSARDDIKSKGLQEKQYSRLQLGGKMEGLWEQFRTAMQSYAEATEHQKIAFEGLKQKDLKSSREIEMQAKKIQKLQDLVAATKARLAAQLQENEEQNRRAREEKEAVLRQLQELKSKMNQARAKAHGSLASLTAQSNAALKALAQVVGKAERILRLAEMCRRLETEGEKVLPFYPSSLAEGELSDADRVLKEKPAEPLAQALQDYVGLERFWQRFNKARLEEQALARERAAVSHKNQQLRGLLRQYLEGLSASPKVLSKPNPLLAIKHKSSVSRACPRQHQATAPLGSPPQGDAPPGAHPRL
ncbi:dynein regulatory complex subunit 2 [Oxyura jamaicensis]|uniref:dynein regulatory complex subunit 2 n=1 Tax=Oxyura jamaicensis TaxID=8884 RepID=UPI0015A71D08|nr:dynein regulatory complex subunit 2 [Oxyura jamaicensis]